MDADDFVDEFMAKYAYKENVPKGQPQCDTCDNFSCLSLEDKKEIRECFTTCDYTDKWGICRLASRMAVKKTELENGRIFTFLNGCCLLHGPKGEHSCVSRRDGVG
jgi:hypothetical protein